MYYIYRVINSDLDQSDQKLSNFKFNFPNASNQKQEGNKTVIIDVLDDPEMGKTQEIDE